MIQKNHIYLLRPKRYSDKKDNICCIKSTQILLSPSPQTHWHIYVVCYCRCSEIVHLTIALGLLFSYTLQFHIALMLVWPELVTDHGPKRHKMLAELGVRLALALSTCQFLSTFNNYTTYIFIILLFLLIIITVLQNGRCSFESSVIEQRIQSSLVTKLDPTLWTILKSCFTDATISCSLQNSCNRSDLDPRSQWN